MVTNHQLLVFLSSLSLSPSPPSSFPGPPCPGLGALTLTRVSNTCRMNVGATETPDNNARRLNEALWSRRPFSRTHRRLSATCQTRVRGASTKMEQSARPVPILNRYVGNPFVYVARRRAFEYRGTNTAAFGKHPQASASIRETILCKGGGERERAGTRRRARGVYGVTRHARDTIAIPGLISAGVHGRR